MSGLEKETHDKKAQHPIQRCLFGLTGTPTFLVSSSVTWEHI